MPYVSDMELLRDYDRQGSETAFAEVVRRHIQALDLADRFHDQVEAVDVGLAQAAARGVHGHRTARTDAHFGDEPGGLAAARGAGSKVILTPHAPGGMTDIQDQLRTAIIQGSEAVEGKK